ncbi:MAG: carbamate kinase [Gaiellaceae bacterium]|jgi:carbamate kinase|nr:carbamate kinase [Gaiellaceae bacterium]
MRPGERGTAAEQLANLRRAVSALQPLLQENALVITHGNGPQVGNELLRQERAAGEAPALPLWLAVAQTQAEIGALIVAELRPALGDRSTACVLTHVRVAAEDPAFDRPTKPIGPFYSAEQGEQLERERGWAMVSDANRGHRRIVPSPEPLEVVELDVIRALARENTVVIACGGGGIPVVRRGNRLTGIDAVVDKDRASALLARGLEAERLLILTEVPAVYRRFGEPDQEEIRELSRSEAEQLLPELAEGSMRPKVEAALGFGGETLITSVDSLEPALAGNAGTRIRL